MLRQIDETSLTRFVEYMRTKLELNVDKKPIHWSEMKIETIILKLEEELAEVKGLIATQAQGLEVMSECADIGNFAMFLGFVYNLKQAEKEGKQVESI